MNSRTSAILLAAVLMLAAALPGARAAETVRFEGWQWSISVAGLGTDLSGDLLDTPYGDVEFNAKRFRAAGLVYDYDSMTGQGVGLGWEATQLVGLYLGLGYRPDWRLSFRGKFGWFLPNSPDQFFRSGSAPPEGELYMENQSTSWHQGQLRLQAEYIPFEPLSIWYVTAGVVGEYFGSSIDISGTRNPPDGAVQDFSGSFSQSGLAAGITFGTGLRFQQGARRDSHVNLGITWFWVPYEGDFYRNTARLGLGGMALEVEFLMGLGTEDQIPEKE